MDRISGANATLVNGLRMWQDRNAQAGVLSGTFGNALWFNGAQESILAPLAQAGITPSDADNTQLLKAIIAIQARGLAVFTQPGAFSFTVPEGWADCHVWVVGGGGGGGSGNGYAGFGGSTGGFAWAVPLVSPGNVLNGYVAACGASDQPGGTSSVVVQSSGVSPTYATGGGAGGRGSASAQNAFGSPGVGMNGIYNLSGTLGFSPNGTYQGGAGGSILFGGAGQGGTTGNDAGSGGYAPGAGGGGGGGNAAGGTGAPGMIFIWR